MALQKNRKLIIAKYVIKGMLVFECEANTQNIFFLEVYTTSNEKVLIFLTKMRN